MVPPVIFFARAFRAIVADVAERCFLGFWGWWSAEHSNYGAFLFRPVLGVHTGDGPALIPINGPFHEIHAHRLHVLDEWRGVPRLLDCGDQGLHNSTFCLDDPTERIFHGCLSPDELAFRAVDALLIATAGLRR